MAAKRPPNDPFMRSSEPLMWLGHAGEEFRRSTSYYYDARRRSDRAHVVIQLTLDGCGFYRRKGKTHLLRPGMAFIDQIPGPFEYGYSPESDGAYHLMFVSLAGSVALRWARRIHRTFGRVLDFGDDRTIADQMQTVVRQTEQPVRVDRYLASAQLYALFMQIHSVLMRSRMQLATRVTLATSLIERHACEPSFNVERLAGMVSCSREHLTRQFREATGVSPSTYLSQYRLRLAARELRREGDKIDAVARRCGFSGANYLCRMFRERFGLTPAQYRAAPGTMVLP